MQEEKASSKEAAGVTVKYHGNLWHMQHEGRALAERRG